MADGLKNYPDIKKYIKEIIPKLEKKLSNKKTPKKELAEIYSLYVDVLRITAKHDFVSFNKYLELDEDHNSEGKAFYHHRKDHLKEVFKAFNDMEIHNKYDMLLVKLPPRTGKSTINIRFLAWIGGRYPEFTEMLTSYSENMTSSFYNGVMEIITNPRFNEVFPESELINQNAKRQEIWLKVVKRYPTLLFIPIGGSMTGRGDAKHYLCCDDLVSGLEEALSITRLEKLWSLYTVNCKQRKLDGCKEVHLATPWSVHDVISKLEYENENNPRCKIIKIPCYNEKGESNFDFFGGFSTEYYKELEKAMDSSSFSALYLCEPIERDGLLYKKEELSYYMQLPNEKPDTIIGLCDSKNLGKDYVSALVGYVYGDTVYVEDVVYNNGLPEITRPLVSNMWLRHNVVRADIELNNGGNYYAEYIDNDIKSKGGNTSIRIFFSGNNKTVKIITYADFVVKNFVFKDPSKYSENSEYAKFMKALFSWTQTGKNKNDDAPDLLAMSAQLVQDLNGISIKVLDRRRLGL